VVSKGSGTQTFGGANTYTGTTEVNSGTLLVNGSHLGAGIGAYTVAANATLGGSGTINAPVTVTGTLSPGTSPGTLIISSSLVLNPASALAMELNGGNTTVGMNVNDVIFGVTNLTLDGTLNVTATPSGSFASAIAGNSWRLIDYSGALTDNGLALGTMPLLSTGLFFLIDLSTIGQVNLLVAAVPEVGASLAVGVVAIGCSLVGLVRRRRAAKIE
jgi:fibronectin-binding autotransporter adhesin